MDGNGIVEALRKLHQSFPNELVELWLGIRPDGSETIASRVGASNPTFEYGSTPAEAADKLISKVGQANEWRQHQIKSLREELARLEGQV